LEPLGGLLGVIWVILEAAGRILGPPGALLGPLGKILGGSWDHFGGVLAENLSYFGAWEASLTRFAEILKNYKKHCKVLQKSRLGESGIDGKLSLECMLGPILMLSLVVGGQVGAKMGKLMQLGGLRGTKLELKGGLGAPKEAPREAKRATVLIEPIAVCLIFEARGPP
jgi:hypothetical protein